MNKLFLLLSILMGAVVLASNYLVQFPIKHYGLQDILTYGAFSYPIAFLITDLANRSYGKEVARKIVYIGFAIGISFTLIFSTNFTDLISIRIAVGSGTAFLVAQLLDVQIFDKLRKKQWFIAPLTSSIIGSTIDTFLFFSISFYGTGIPWITLSLGDLMVKILVALMMLIPPKKLPLEKSGKNEIGPVSKWIGSLTKTPLKVIMVTIIVSVPMFIGFQQLEVGFDQRDNFDTSVPVVQDFLTISDEFQSSPSPLYAVLEGDVISQEGRLLYDEVVSSLEQNSKVTGLPIGIWSVLEESRTSNPELDTLMLSLDGDQSSWLDLEQWLLSEAGRNISSGTLNSKASQTVISFQAATLDWQATADFESELSEFLKVFVI